MRNILVFTKYYLPGYKSGGPPKSIHNLVKYFQKDFNFHIVASDRDFGDKSPYPGKQIYGTNFIEKVPISYLGKNIFKNFFYIYRLISSSDVDCIYINSLYPFWFSIIPLIFWKTFSKKKKFIIAPRGELHDAAIDIKKYKKLLFFKILKLFNIYKNVLWHATSLEEKKYIKNRISKKSKIITAKNFIINKKNYQKKTTNKKNIKIIYLSRINRIKNLHFFLKLLCDVKIKITFDIYGPVDDIKYWNYCREIIHSIPKNVSIKYRGSIHRDKVDKVLSNYDLFVLLSLSENFGHVILEALSNNVPVIISENTPLKKIKSYNLGWVINNKNSNLLLEILDSLPKSIDDLNYKFEDRYAKFYDDFFKMSDIKRNYFKLFNLK